MPKIVKLFPPTKKAKLQTIYCTKKGRPNVIKNYEDSDNSKNNSKSKSSSEMSFWDPPDLSPGERLLHPMNLCDNSKSLIISVNLCNIKNMNHPKCTFVFTRLIPRN
jgi:hypothetical protein